MHKNLSILYSTLLLYLCTQLAITSTNFCSFASHVPTPAHRTVKKNSFKLETLAETLHTPIKICTDK
jgi:hypothetical protein